MSDDNYIDLDVLMVLIRLRRKGLLKSIRPDATKRDLSEDAAHISRELARAIGGRYIPKTDKRPEVLAARNEAIYVMWNGRNRDELMKHFGISRSLFYLILREERKQRSQVAQVEAEGRRHGQRRKE